MKETAQNLSRYYGGRIGRARLNTKAEPQPSRPPTGNAIITAEYTPEISVSKKSMNVIIPDKSKMKL